MLPFGDPLDEIETAVRAALEEERQGFSFRVINEGDTPRYMRRFVIAVSYRGESFSRVKLEVSAYEGGFRDPEYVPAPRLEGFGLTAADRLPCLPLTKQITQKLHAVTEPPELGATNDRFRDLVDLVLLSAIAPPSLLLREVCEETFSVRGKHSWPPKVIVYEQWVEPLTRLSAELGLEGLTATKVGALVEAYVEAIAFHSLDVGTREKTRSGSWHAQPRLPATQCLQTPVTAIHVPLHRTTLRPKGPISSLVPHHLWSQHYPATVSCTSIG